MFVFHVSCIWLAWFMYQLFLLAQVSFFSRYVWILDNAPPRSRLPLAAEWPSFSQGKKQEEKGNLLFQAQSNQHQLLAAGLSSSRGYAAVENIAKIM
ncbi:hypothetical protein AKJ16_DCAP21796 [Drosera capensis]